MKGKQVGLNSDSTLDDTLLGTRIESGKNDINRTTVDANNS